MSGLSSGIHDYGEPGNQGGSMAGWSIHSRPKEGRFMRALEEEKESCWKRK